MYKQYRALARYCFYILILVILVQCEVDIIETFKTIWDGLDWSYLSEILIAVIPSLLCITLHELSHGYVAYKLGDNTAKNSGRLTLNPIKHIDVMGLVMLVVCRFGWAKPVPVNMNNFKNPKRGMAITALAGPVSNLIIGVIFLFIYGLFYIFLSKDNQFCSILNEMVLVTAYLSIGLAVFNIIPISPLDGSKVLFSFLNQSTYRKIMYYEKYGMLILLVLVFSGVLGRPLSTIISFVFDKLFIFAKLGYNLAMRIF